MQGLRQLASGLVRPQALAVDDRFVYWGDAAAGTVCRVARDGSGDPVVLADELGAVVDLALDGGTLVVASCEEEGAILRLESAGGSAPEIAAEGLPFPGHVALGDGEIFFTLFGDDRDNGVVGVLAPGGDVRFVAEGEPGPRALVCDGEHLFWRRSTGDVLALPRTGGEPIVVRRPADLVQERLVAGDLREPIPSGPLRRGRAGRPGLVL
jgi:hypothetical protein